MIDTNGHHDGQQNGHETNGQNGHTTGTGGGFDYFEPPTLSVESSVSSAGDSSDEGEPIFPPEEKYVYLVSPVDPKWEPTQRQLKMYEALCETGDFRRVAETYRTSVRQVERLVQRIDAWVKSQHMDEIWSIRVRQKKFLEKLFARAIQGYEISCGDEVKTTEGFSLKGPVSTTTVTKRGEGNPAFLSLAKEILSDIRKLTGADKAPTEGQVGNSYSVSQFNSRADAIKAHMVRMEQALHSLNAENN